MVAWNDVLYVFKWYSQSCVSAAIAIHGKYHSGPNTPPMHGHTARLGGTFQRFLPVNVEVFKLVSGPPVPAVYMIASLHHRGTYIGQTRDLVRRTTDHFRTSFRSLLSDSAPAQGKLQRVHRYILQLGVSDFFVAPLAIFPQQVATRTLLRVERLFIRRLQPPLNSCYKFKSQAQQPSVSKCRKNAKRRRRASAYATHGDFRADTLELLSCSRVHARETNHLETVAGMFQRSETELSQRKEAIHNIRLFSAVYLKSRFSTATRHLAAVVGGSALPPNLCHRVKTQLEATMVDWPEFPLTNEHSKLWMGTPNRQLWPQAQH